MNGRERIVAALSPEGTPEVAAVIPYEGIFFRDHWDELEVGPWGLSESPDPDTQRTWRAAVARRLGLDWYVLPEAPPRAAREQLALEVRPDGVYRVDRRAGQVRRLERPAVGGDLIADRSQATSLPQADSPEAIDRLIPLPLNDSLPIQDGRDDLARALRQDLGDLFPLQHVGAPLWSTWSLWGFEGMMLRIAQQPALVHHACRRFLTQALHAVRVAAALGVQGIWIEDCMTDMVAPDAFAALNLPYLQELVAGIRAAGMASIYYFCGDPGGKWEQLLAVGADALSLEESKKGFAIDLAEVVERVQGRCALLGNLDAIQLLPRASEEALRAELARQLAWGRRNGGRFIMSLGSPVTPGTTLAQVRRYADLVHALGRL